MLLAIDIGNSNIVVGYIENMEVIRVFRLVTDTDRTEEGYTAALKVELENGGTELSEFEGVIISSVVPKLVPVFENAVYSLTGHRAIVVGAKMCTGLNILIDDPEKLGSDLVAGSVAAITYYKPPIIILDMGTATTMAVIDADSNYVGGAIAPGVMLSMNALTAGTSLLPGITIDAPEKCISSNTVDCMRSGAVFGAAAMVDGMIDRMEQELGEKATVVATGGLAKKITKYCKREIIHDEHLLLRGLAVLYEKNKLFKIELGAK